MRGRLTLQGAGKQWAAGESIVEFSLGQPTGQRKERDAAAAARVSGGAALAGASSSLLPPWCLGPISTFTITRTAPIAKHIPSGWACYSCNKQPTGPGKWRKPYLCIAKLLFRPYFIFYCSKELQGHPISHGWRRCGG
jgi:hypothetical protein